ncbi:MAG TPA: ATP-dependent Clp protease proteolytic subunit [Verrucomicrobiae bacterium]
MENESANLARTRTILLGLPINDEVASQIIAKLLFLQNRDARAPIQLFVNSPGGSVTAGIAILKKMDELKLPIRTHCLRFCGGVATTVLAHGAKGMRTASPDSQISLSRVYGGNPKGRTQTQIDLEVERVTNALLTEMADDTGQTTDQLSKDMAEERFFAPDDAREYGLIDNVIAPSISSP